MYVTIKAKQNLNQINDLLTDFILRNVITINCKPELPMSNMLLLYKAKFY